MNRSPYLLDLKNKYESNDSHQTQRWGRASYVIFAAILIGSGVMTSVVWYAPTLASFARGVTHVGEFFPHVPALRQALGYPTPRRYLLLFENSHELRPTGGFIGSYGLLEFHRGRITSFTIPTSGTYGLQWNTPTIPPPPPMLLVNKRFEMQDANWWPDFPTSARAVLAFWQASGNSDVDGVIAITNRFITRALSVSGPITLSDPPLTISADNFSTTAGSASSLDWDSTSAPRQFISSLSRPLLTHLTQYARAQPGRALSTILESVAQKDIQVYTKNPGLEALVRTLGADGRFLPLEDDGLGIVFANINGGKTDGAITTNVKIFTRLEHNLRHHHLTITRTSSAIETNHSYLRLYLPATSRVEDASGFSDGMNEIPSVPQWNSEGKFNVLEGWTNLRGGETQTIMARFNTPTTSSGSFTFRFLKQAGLSPLLFEHEIMSTQPLIMTLKRPRDLMQTQSGSMIKIEGKNPPDLIYQFERRVEADI